MTKTAKHGGGPQPPPCIHRGNKVAIGDHYIYAGGVRDLMPEHLGLYELRIFLRAEAPGARKRPFGHFAHGCLWLPIEDYKTVPEIHWNVWIESLQRVKTAIESNQRVIAFCYGGHGRTGLFLASMLALFEPEIKDPVAEIRSRYCERAVETTAQKEQVERLLREIRKSH